MVSQEMTLGELYKNKRCDLNLSVKEVESATSIRSAYIEAIESNSSENLISDVYMKGFMRQYAVFLGLDLEALTKEFQEQFLGEPKTKEPEEFSFGLGGIEMRPGTLSGSFWKSNNLIWIVGFIVVFAAAFFLIKLLGIF